MKKYELTPAKITYSGIATVVFWQDGTKTVVKRSKGTKDDRYNAFCAALAKKVYGTNSKLKNCIKEAENAKKIKVERTKELKIDNTPINVGDRVQILDGKNIPDYTGTWTHEMDDKIGMVFTVERVRRYSETRTGAYVKEDVHIYDVRGLKRV